MSKGLGTSRGEQQKLGSTAARAMGCSAGHWWPPEHMPLPTGYTVKYVCSSQTVWAWLLRSTGKVWFLTSTLQDNSRSSEL